MNSKTTNILLSLFIWIVCIIFYFQTIQFNYPSNVFPYIVIGCMLICSIIILVQTFMKQEHTNTKSTTEKSYRKPFIIVIFSVIVISSIQWIGFYVVSFISIFLFTVFLYHKGDAMRNKILKSGTFSLLITLFVYMMFGLILGVKTPQGILF